jgi:hypothetical protein
MNQLVISFASSSTEPRMYVYPKIKSLVLVKDQALCRDVSYSTTLDSALINVLILEDDGQVIPEL